MSVLALLFAVIGSARAQEPTADYAEEADLQFRIGIDAYRAGRYDEALEHLLASNRLVPNRNVVFNIAKCYERLGDYARAWRHFTDYVGVEPDPARRRAGEEAIAELVGRVALVKMTTDPPGATIYVDRRDLGPRGKTPLSLALEPGRHEIIVELDGYVGGSAPAELAIGRTAVVDLALEQILGQLRVDGTPAGAAVRLDEDDAPVLGVLPATLELPPGPHVLVVSADGYRETRQLVQVEAGGEARAVLDLPLVTGSLVVDAFERDALVEVDGRAAGFTPAVLEVPVGAHHLKVTLRGYRPWETDVVVVEDQSTAVEAQLRSLQEVIAASRTSQAVEDAPASVSLIGAEEIRAFGYVSLADALAGTRGLYASNDLTYESLGVRGFSRAGDYGNRVLVTLDGHTTNDDQLGGSYVGADFLTDLRDVERIEVVRGPGSALYGTSAFFGVVNVVTRDAATKLPPHVAVTGDGLSVARGRAGASLGDEDLGGWLSVSGASATGGDYLFPEYAASRTAGASVDRDGFTSQSALARGWAGDLTLQGYYNGRSKEIPSGSFGTILADSRAHTDDHRSFGELRYEPEIGESTRFYGRVYLDHYTFSGDYPYGPAYIYSDSWRGTWAGAEPRLVTTVADRLTLTVGAEVVSHLAARLVSTENVDLDGSPPLGTPLDESPTSQVYAGYGVAEVSLGPVDLSAGARYDLFFTSVDDYASFNPRLAALIHPSDSDVVKLLAGTAFRSPSPYEFFYNDGGLTQISPETLSPERIRTAEVEYTHRFGDVTSLTLAGYGNQIDDLVSLSPIREGADAGLLQYQNTGVPVRTVGGEAELRRDWRQGWMAAVQHSVQRTREGDLFDGDPLDNSPSHLFSVKGAAPLAAGASTVASRIRAEAPRLVRDGSFTDWALLWDLTLSGSIRVVQVQWAIGVRNALDWEVVHPTGDELRMTTVPQAGRTLFASVAAEL